MTKSNDEWIEYDPECERGYCNNCRRTKLYKKFEKEILESLSRRSDF